MISHFFKFRLFPVTLAASALFVLVKIDDIAQTQKYLARGIIPPAYAQATEEVEAKKEVIKEKLSTEDTAKQMQEEMASKEQEQAKQISRETLENGNVMLTAPEDILKNRGQFNQIELDILQNLAQRREEIDRFAEEVAMREKLLNATELRIDEKIKDMEKMQVDLKALLEQNKTQEDSEMRSLVKIYESMKPKDAARIFDELDMNILLEVVDRMSERKAAPVLANMTPTKAKDVTVRLAEMRQLRQQAAKDLSGAMGDASN